MEVIHRSHRIVLANSRQAIEDLIGIQLMIKVKVRESQMSLTQMPTHRRAFHQYLRNLMLTIIRLRSPLPSRISISTAWFRTWSIMFVYMPHEWNSSRMRRWGIKVNKLAVMTNSPAIPPKTQRMTWKIVLEWESASQMFNLTLSCRDKMTFCRLSTFKTKSACLQVDMAGA